MAHSAMMVQKVHNSADRLTNTISKFKASRDQLLIDFRKRPLYKKFKWVIGGRQNIRQAFELKNRQTANVDAMLVSLSGING